MDAQEGRPTGPLTKRQSPFVDMKRATSRRNLVLQRMADERYITQAQADKVATTLDQALPQGPPGGPGHRGGPRLLEDAAQVLGMTVDQLRTAMGSTTSLADVASTKGVSKADLINKLLALVDQHLAADVKAGRLTQAQADQHKADAKAHISGAVDRVGLPPRPDGPPPQAGTAAPDSDGT